MKSLLQTPEWVSLKVAQGWKSHEVEGIFVLEKKLPLGKSFLYAPEVEYKLLQNTKIYENTKKIAENAHSIFLRLEILDENRQEQARGGSPHRCPGIRRRSGCGRVDRRR